MPAFPETPKPALQAGSVLREAGFEPTTFGYETDPLARLSYVEPGFKPKSRDLTTWRSAGICGMVLQRGHPPDSVTLVIIAGMKKVFVSLPLRRLMNEAGTARGPRSHDTWFAATAMNTEPQC